MKPAPPSTIPFGWFTDKDLIRLVFHINITVIIRIEFLKQYDTAWEANNIAEGLNAVQDTIEQMRNTSGSRFHRSQNA